MSPSINIEETSIVSNILEIINSAILLINAEGQIVLANSKAAKMFRTSREQLEQWPLSRLFMPDDREIFLPNILNLTKEKGEYEGEAMLLRPDGTTFIAMVATSAWDYQQGQGIVITIHDVTGFKELERVLRSSERMAFLGRMLDDISHQIRNPVLSIGGFARRLYNMDCPKPEYVKVILNESGRLEQLLKTLTEFLSMPRPELAMVPVKKLIDHLLPGIQSTIKETGLKLEVELSGKLEGQKVLVDPKIFQQALQAVIINACEAYEEAEAHGCVEVQVVPSTDERWACMIKVRDYGMGIRPGILPNIFDPFFTTKTGHVGMGLTFAKRMQEEQEGNIRVDSTLGSGTTVFLALAGERRRHIRTKMLNDK